MGCFPVTFSTNLEENVLWACSWMLVLVSVPAWPELWAPLLQLLVSCAHHSEQLLPLNREKAGTVQCYLQDWSHGWKENSSSQCWGEQQRGISLAALLLELIMLSHCITWPHMPGHRNVFLCATPVQFLVLDKHSQRCRDGLCHSSSRWQHTQHSREVRNHCQHSKTMCSPCVKHLHKCVKYSNNLCSRSFLSSLFDCLGKMHCQVGSKHFWFAYY